MDIEEIACEVVDWIDMIQDRELTGSCEQDTHEFIYQLSDHQLIKKNSAPPNYIM
jgi:hypothetical protein